MSISKEALLEKVRAAFTNVPYPGDTNIVYEDDLWDSEGRLVLNALIGKHWTKIEPNIQRPVSKDVDAGGYTVFSHDNTLSFLTPEAFHFYLPAFLIASLDVLNNGFIIMSVLSSLSPDRFLMPSPVFAQKLALLTEDQREAIGMFWAYLFEHHPDEVSGYNSARIAEYWSKPRSSNTSRNVD